MRSCLQQFMYFLLNEGEQSQLPSESLKETPTSLTLVKAYSPCSI